MDEAAAQPRSLKLTFKIKRDKIISNCSTTANHLDNVGGEHNVSDGSPLPGSAEATSQEQLDLNAEVVENGTENEENPSPGNSQYQLVLYDPTVNGDEADPERIGYRPPRSHPFSNQAPRVLPSVGAFTVQCANCFKWRLIPTKEKYEELREHIIEKPFLCETAREWRPDISCDDEADIKQDGSRLWAIDKPNIAQPPPGWQRLLRIRGEGSSKFADVYYVAPTGKRLRSMVEIQRFLNERPRYAEEGVSMSQFSFQIPRPLHDNYVKKRHLSLAPPAPLTRAALPNDAEANAITESLDPSHVNPLSSWSSPGVDTDLQLTVAGISSKRKRTLSKRSHNGDVVFNNTEEEPPQI